MTDTPTTAAGRDFVALAPDNGTRDARRRVVVAIEQEAATRALDALDGLPHLLSDILRKYGGTMKGRGDHDIYDALVRYRAAIEQAKGAERIDPSLLGDDPDDPEDVAWLDAHRVEQAKGAER